MANSKHVKILKKGAAVWNDWRYTNQGTIPDLSGIHVECADLKEANLSGANLNGTILNDVDLIGANLVGASLNGAKLNDAKLNRARLGNADLRSAELSGADFSEADLISANLSSAILIDTNLTGAYLVDTNLNGAYLNGATFDQAKLGNTALNNTDISQAKELHLVEHGGPSSIGIDTLYQSKGQIPEVFLRGCGVPESFITQAKALVGAEDGIQFYSCFISYSTKDDDFARRLHARLQQEHVRVWFAPHDMQSGKKLHEQIDEAIKVYDKLLILLSPDSIISEWVMTELRKARKAERKIGRRKLFPIGLVDYTTLQDWECFDADGGQDLAVEVRQYFIPDFTNWKDHDAFEAAFARLLKDLRASEKAAGSAW